MMGKPIAKPKHKIITGRIVKRKQSAAPDYEQDVPEDAVMMDRAIAHHYRQDSYQSSGESVLASDILLLALNGWADRIHSLRRRLFVLASHAVVKHRLLVWQDTQQCQLQEANPRQHGQLDQRYPWQWAY